MADKTVQVQPKLLNTGKAGMESVDFSTASEIIRQASEGSNFYARQQEKQRDIVKKIEEMHLKMARLTDEQINVARQKMDCLATHLEKKRNLGRIIVHIDMDAFYAAVEMRDDPSLTTKPMAVGGANMLCTSNYHARKFGVRAGMPGFIAKKLCPSLIIVPLNFEKYTRVSKDIRCILATFDPEFCPMGLDEAYLDITHLVESKYRCQNEADVLVGIHISIMKTKEAIAGEIVNTIREKIRNATNLTASAGIAVNKMLAKICSDKNKPNGQFILDFDREKIMQFVNDMPISKVCGIGNVTEQFLGSLDIRTGSDLLKRRDVLACLFSEISVESFLRISLGLGSTKVPNDDVRKSMSVERTFKDTSDRNVLQLWCKELCTMLSKDLKKEKIVGKTITLKLKTSSFHVKTRAKSLPFHTSSVNSINSIACNLLEHEMKSPQLKLRLMGVRISSLLNETEVAATISCERVKQFTLDHFIRNDIDDDVECDEALHVCPLCGLEERSLMLLNNHVGNCIGETSGQHAIDIDTKRAATVPSQDWICPICQMKVKFKVGHDQEKIIAFNDHIDACLNRKAVKEVLELERDHYKSPGQKRSPSPLSKSTVNGSRKRFRRGGVTGTIDKFLIGKHKNT